MQKRRSIISWPILVWDILFWVTVLFPLLTGGIWINQPGLRFELTQLNLPMAVLSVVAFFMHFYGGLDMQRASSLKLVLRAWDWWSGRVKKSPARSLLAATLFFAVLGGLAALRRHWAFSSDDADLGIFTNAIWNLTFGNGYISSVKDGINLFSDHQSPFFWIFVPLFWLVPHPELLLVVQALGLCSGGIALFYLAKPYLPKDHPCLPLLPLLYWSYQPLRNANRFDFHPEVFMLPLFLWAIVLLQSKIGKKQLWGGLLFLLALSTKESAGPVAVGIGLAWILGAAPKAAQPFTKKLGFVAIPLGLALFYFNTSVVPQFFDKSYAYQNVYAHLGNSVWEIILSPFTRPLDFFSAIMNEARLKFFVASLLPLAFLPLINWRVFVAALPGYLMLFLSQGDHRISLGYHYCIEFAVALFWALPGAIVRFDQHFWFPWFRLERRLIVIWLIYRFSWLKKRLLVLILSVCVLVSYGRGELYYIRFFQPTAHEKWLQQQFLPCIRGTPITAPRQIVPHLATRPWVNSLPDLTLGKDTTNRVNCVLLDKAYPLGQNMRDMLKREDYTLEYSCQGTMIYSFNYFSVNCLICRPECAIPNEKP